MITQEQIDLANSPLGITLGFGPVRSTDGQIGCASHKDDNSRIAHADAYTGTFQTGSMTKLRRSECAILPLVLEGKWFNMIATGEKREEYRDATPYWHIRLHNWNRRVSRDVAPVVEFRCGYSSSAPRMAFWVLGLQTESGLLSYAETDKARHPSWGEPSKPHFVIALGGRVEFDDECGKEAVDK